MAFLLSLVCFEASSSRLLGELFFFIAAVASDLLIRNLNINLHSDLDSGKLLCDCRKYYISRELT